MEKNLRPVILCADDYGISPSVSEIIRTLIADRRLTATGSMTLFEEWPREATSLRELTCSVPADVGLHFTLTDHPPLTGMPGLTKAGRLPSIGQLLPRALAHTLPLVEIRQELQAQLNVFEDAWGGPPDFIDGHQHVHVLPGIREILVAEVIRRYGTESVYLRDCYEPWGRCRQRRCALPKALLISSLALGLSRLIRRQGLSSNRGFSGLHDFSGQPPFAQLMPRFLTSVGPMPLVHVHPGRVDPVLEQRDTLTAPREREWHYLASATFLEALNQAGLQPGTFADLKQHAHV